MRFQVHELPQMKVLLISDSPLVITGLRAVILDTIHTAHFTEAKLPAEAPDLCQGRQFQLAIIDIARMDITNLDLIASLKTAHPEMIIWVNLRSDFTLLRSLLKTGVNGILSSKSSSAEFRSALLNIDKVGRFISEEIQGKLISAFIGGHFWPTSRCSRKKLPAFSQRD